MEPAYKPLVNEKKASRFEFVSDLRTRFLDPQRRENCRRTGYTTGYTTSSSDAILEVNGAHFPAESTNNRWVYGPKIMTFRRKTWVLKDGFSAESIAY